VALARRGACSPLGAAEAGGVTLAAFWAEGAGARKGFPAARRRGERRGAARGVLFKDTFVLRSTPHLHCDQERVDLIEVSKLARGKDCAPSRSRSADRRWRQAPELRGAETPRAAATRRRRSQGTSGQGVRSRTAVGAQSVAAVVVRRLPRVSSDAWVPSRAPSWPPTRALSPMPRSRWT
jgi:hypothetical protein